MFRADRTMKCMYNIMHITLYGVALGDNPARLCLRLERRCNVNYRLPAMTKTIDPERSAFRYHLVGTVNEFGHL